jgi:hypothetical protein
MLDLALCYLYCDLPSFHASIKLLRGAASGSAPEVHLGKMGEGFGFRVSGFGFRVSGLEHT